MSTANLGIDYLLQNQSSPEVTINEAIEKLDAMIFQNAQEIIIELPSSPENGIIYILDSTHELHPNKIAIWVSNKSWQYIEPKIGWGMYIIATQKRMRFTENGWQVEAEIQEPFPELHSIASSGDYNELINKPTFHDVCWSGNYEDLINKPQNTGIGKNYIINGGFDIWQRGISIEYTGGSPIYFCDRWFGRRGSSHAGQIVSKQWDITHKHIAIVQRKQGNTLSGDLNLAQIIESKTVEKLAGKTITISAWVKLGADFSANNGTVTMSIRTGTVANQGGSPYGFTTGTLTIGNSTTPNAKGVWHKLTTTVTIPENAKSMLVQFLCANMQGTAGINDYFEVAEVKCEIGSATTAFETQDYFNELQKCKVYFDCIKSGNSGIFIVAQTVSVNQCTAYYQFPKQMRKIPTITIQPNDVKVRINGTQYDVSSIETTPEETFAMMKFNTTQTIPIGTVAEIIFTNANGRITFDAEI